MNVREAVAVEAEEVSIEQRWQTAAGQISECGSVRTQSGKRERLRMAAAIAQQNEEVNETR